MSRKNVYWAVADVNLNNAGYRVRTLPLIAALADFGISPVVVSLQQLSASIEEVALDAAVVIIAKPGTTTTHLCMQFLLAHKVRVLIDIFDNYFCWSPALYERGIPWLWLRALQTCSGVITSTPHLAEAIAKLGFAPPCVVSDPVAPVASVGTAELRSKWLCPGGRLELLWFGIASNPYFSAGLDDLVSWTDTLVELQRRMRHQAALRLTICTSPCEEVSGALILLQRSGVELCFVEWTAAACEALQERTHVVLIPSNTSPFGLSKTHNRCSEALSRQCLVLCSPNGPYREIPGAVHSAVGTLCAALTGDLATLADAFNTSGEFLSRSYGMAKQARKLAELITAKTTATVEKLHPEFKRPPILVLGQGGGGTVKLSRRLGYLVVGFDGAGMGFNCDLTLAAARDELLDGVTLRLSPVGARALRTLGTGGAFDVTTSAQAAVAWVAGEEAITVQLEALRPLLARRRQLTLLVSDHLTFRARIFDISVEILLHVLKALGFSRIELCATQQGGWSSYLRLANPPLGAAVQRFTQLHGKPPRAPAREAPRAVPVSMGVI
jgi:hypothetical protein